MSSLIINSSILSFNKKALLFSVAVSISKPDKSTFDETIFKLFIFVSSLLYLSKLVTLPPNSWKRSVKDSTILLPQVLSGYKADAFKTYAVCTI